jgi:hypothetical protein
LREALYRLLTPDEFFHCHSACKIDPLSWGIGVQN